MIRNACSDYKDMSAVLGDLKLTNEGQLQYSDPNGARRSFDLAGHTKIDELIRDAAGGNPQSRGNFIQTLDQWKNDGHHNQHDIDWAMKDYTQQLQSLGKLNGILHGMKVMGVDPTHNKIMLANPAEHTLAAMDANTGAVYAGSMIAGIGGVGFGGMGNGRNPFSKFVKLENAGGTGEEITEEVVNKAITAGADTVDIGGETVFSRTVLLEAGEGTTAAVETGAAVVEGGTATAGALETSAALGETWEVLLALMAL